VVSRIPGLSVHDALSTPFLAIGTHDEIADHLLACRNRWGISYFSVRDIDGFRPGDPAASRYVGRVSMVRRAVLPAGARGNTLWKDKPVQGRQTVSIVAGFSKDYSDADMEFGRSVLQDLGFHETFVLTSQSPKLVVALGADATPEQIDEVVVSLGSVEHVDTVRIAYPSSQGDP
jgi:hypothetical protein